MRRRLQKRLFLGLSAGVVLVLLVALLKSEPRVENVSYFCPTNVCTVSFDVVCTWRCPDKVAVVARSYLSDTLGKGRLVTPVGSQVFIGRPTLVIGLRSMVLDIEPGEVQTVRTTIEPTRIKVEMPVAHVDVLIER